MLRGHVRNGGEVGRAKLDVAATVHGEHVRLPGREAGDVDTHPHGGPGGLVEFDAVRFDACADM